MLIFANVEMTSIHHILDYTESVVCLLGGLSINLISIFQCFQMEY
jgi:hypothetical protein